MDEGESRRYHRRKVDAELINGPARVRRQKGNLS